VDLQGFHRWHAGYSGGVDCGVVVLGAGPYGLAASAHLRGAGADTHVFGRPMHFWHRRMPAGMFLRSAWEASSIAHPERRLTLDEYRDAEAPGLSAPIPIDDFLRYAEWFRQHEVPDVDEREVVSIERDGDGFRLGMDDGEELRTGRVVVATGLAPFAARPREFDGIPSQLASHSGDHTDFAGFDGRSVLVIGGGQSALESAALLREAGAEVAVAVRASHVHWLPAPRLTGQLAPARRHLYRPIVHRLLYPSTDVGPPGLNWIVALPPFFRAFPRRLQEPMAQRCIRPAGADWLRSRLAGVEISTGRTVSTARPDGNRLRVDFADGTETLVDHALLATGFRIDVRRLRYLAPELAREIVVDDGYPLLSRGLESSVPGLHFIGAPAARSFGPVMRFVSGTRFTGRELTRGVLARRSRHPRRPRRRAVQAGADAARSA
jgi:FAD-dependent urate hydroxylase